MDRKWAGLNAVSYTHLFYVHLPLRLQKVVTNVSFFPFNMQITAFCSTFFCTKVSSNSNPLSPAHCCRTFTAAVASSHHSSWELRLPLELDLLSLFHPSHSHFLKFHDQYDKYLILLTASTLLNLPVKYPSVQVVAG